MKDNTAEKRKRAAPTKRFRPSTAPKPNETVACLPTTVFKAPVNIKPQTDASENRPPPLENAPVCTSTPWPGAERMSGNLFKDRNWLLPPNYLNNNSKNTTGITSPTPPITEEPKIGELSIISPKGEKCGWGPNCPFCKNQDKEDWDGKHQNQLQQKTPPQPKMQRPKARCPQNLNYQKPQNSQKSNSRNTNQQVSKSNKNRQAMGSRDGKIEHQIQLRLLLRLLS